ncbi:stromal membrane-associated protein 1 isoform X2 [Athalia rosae]|uniref:stromal membrane-associated protein 1 isoform X2 n=1 Tax=Athalia rosae TaxID=37344 RepID=UPI0020339FC2|nr:stromal membrane-associated protein 1 isoform X2 [Athalia rosae]
MTSRLEKERTKQIQEKCQTLLTQMLRDEDNKYCVDCDAKGPRWASWNLGIFLCIRCAGIHRNLGVHISKVKSVNLDTWTPEQVVSLQQMGNSRARAVYEANLPDSFRRPQTDSGLECFIRAKYEHKKHIAKEWVPPPLPKINWDKELDLEAERQRRRKKEGSKNSGAQTPLPPVKKPETVPQLPKPRCSVSPKTGRAHPSATLDLLGLDAPSNQSNANGSTSGEDIFSSFLSAPPAPASQSSNGAANGGAEATATAEKTEEESFFNQPAPTPQEKSKMTKDSILALYATPNQQQSMFGGLGGMYAQQTTAQQFPPQMQGVQGFHQQANFQSQAMGPMNAVQGQLAMQGQMGGPPTNQLGAQLAAVSGSHVTGNSMHMGQMTQMNGVQNPAMGLMGNQMGGVMQMGQNSSINGWSGMLANQNLQPAPGSNPFFNLPNQQQQSTAFTNQLPQRMTQMTLGASGFPSPSPSGKTAATTLPGQTLSNNLWQ